MRLVGGFGKGETRKQSADEEADIWGKAEVRFVDGAHGGGDSVGEERADPIFGFGADGIGAERVNVVGDGPFAEAGGG